MSATSKVVKSRYPVVIRYHENSNTRIKITSVEMELQGLQAHAIIYLPRIVLTVSRSQSISILKYNYTLNKLECLKKYFFFYR